MVLGTLLTVLLSQVIRCAEMVRAGFSRGPMRVRLYRRTAVWDRVGQVLETPGFVGIHLAEPVPGAVEGQSLYRGILPDIDGTPERKQQRSESAGCGVPGWRGP